MPAQRVPVSRIVHTSAELACIYDEDINLCVLPRSPSAALLRFGQACLQRPINISRVVPVRVPDLAALFSELAHLEGFEDFVADVSRLATLYAMLLEPDALGLRLHRLEQPMCPRLHVDRVGIRLLCTYAGPGTQWLDDPAADRSLLGPGAAGRSDEDSGLIRAADRVREIPTLAVALLKGEAFPGSEGAGAIHRSPSTQTPRLLLSLDAIWESP
jgi:hypothetical protein